MCIFWSRITKSIIEQFQNSDLICLLQYGIYRIIILFILLTLKIVQKNIIERILKIIYSRNYKKYLRTVITSVNNVYK